MNHALVEVEKNLKDVVSVKAREPSLLKLGSLYFN